MHTFSNIRVLYLNDWIKGSWQVQTVHAREFLEAFQRQPGIQVFTYPQTPISKKQNIHVKIEKQYLDLTKQFLKKRVLYPLLKLFLNEISYKKNNFMIRRYINIIQPDLIIARYNQNFFPILYNLTKHKRPLILEVNALVAHGLSVENIDSRIALFEKNIILRADALFTVCKTTSELIKEIGVDPDRVFTVPNGVDPFKFSPQPKSEELYRRYGLSKHVVIGYVGGFTKEEHEGRNVLGMLEAFKIAKIESGIPLKMLMIGRMDEDCLWKEIKRLGITKSVVFTGFINHSQVPKFMNLIDIAVAPYFERRLIDRSPIKLFEYMAMEKPTVIPGIGQPAEILVNKKSAVLVEAESPLSMSEGLIMLIRDDSLRKKIGENARELILEKYTWEHNARNIANICRLVLEKKIEK